MKPSRQPRTQWIENLEPRQLLSGTASPVVKPLVLAAPSLVVANDGGTNPIPNGTTTALDLGFGILGQTGTDNNSYDGLTIANQGGVALTISNVSVPAGFTSTLPKTSQIGTGSSSSENFTLALDTSSEGTKSGTFSFSVSGTGVQTETYSFPVKGSVVGSTPSKTLTFSNGQFVDPNTAQPATGTLNFTPTIDDTAHEILTAGDVVYLMKLPYGSNNVQVGLDATQNDLPGEVSLYLYKDTNGNGKLDLSEKSNPLATVSFTNQNGSSSDQSGTASPTGGAVSGGNYFVEVNTLALDFGDDTPLTTNYTVTVTDTDAGSPGLSMTAADGVSAASGSFGTVATNATATKTFTVKNTGTSTLHFPNTPSVTVPSGFSLTSDLPSSLAAGQSAQFTVAMNTSSTGAKSGNLTITNDATGSPYTLALSGSVGAPAGTTGTVSGIVFNDKNGDGVKERKDAVMPGIAITLQPTKRGKAAGHSQTTTSASDGSYAFTKVAAGSYTLSESTPRNYGVTSPVGNSFAFGVTAGQTVSENFGNQKGFKTAVARSEQPFVATAAATPSQADDSILLFSQPNQTGVFAN